jgi:C4-dicarboxylate-specific signal transduction histidine kinase/ActR/RegA family two-component response regulator
MNTSLGKRILAPTLAMVALAMVATLVITQVNAHRAAREELGNRLQRETQIASRLIDNWLQARRVDLALWAQEEVLVKRLAEPTYYDQQGRDRVQQFLVSRQQAHPYFEGILLADLRGRVVAFSTMEAQALAHVTLMDRLYFRETLAGKQVLSKVLISKLSGNKVFAVTAPVKVKGEVVGVVTGVIDFAAFVQLFLQNFQEHDQGHAFISDAQGTILCSSAGNEAELAQHDDLLSLHTSDQHRVATHTIADEEFITASQPIHLTELTLTIYQPLAAALQPLFRAGQISGVIGLGILALLFVLVTALFRRLISERVGTMLQTMARVKEGDLSPRLPQTGSKEDEFAVLNGSFNEMIAHLEATINRLNDEIQMRKDSEAMLAYHQEHLEEIVAERSRDLESEILERKRVEERLARVEKLEMIGTLAGGVAHDLNNILSGVITYPDLLLLKLDANSPLVKPLQSIKLSGEKAAAIIQDLLTLARRGVSVSKNTINLATVVEDYLHGLDYRQLCNNRPDIELITECSADLPAIFGSPQPLAKTVANLVRNGIEALPQGGRIRLTLTPQTVKTPRQGYEQIPPGCYVVLTVTDEGEGIAAHHLARIFEPFYTSKKMGRADTGLGMAVVWGTVKDHHGFIDCVSRPGMGTTFTLYFPADMSAAPHPVGRPDELAAIQGQGERILLIDDAPEQRELASITLTELGYGCTVAASGEEGLEQLAGQRFALILLDMVLGQGMDGLDTYRCIRGQWPQQKVLIVSGYAESERLIETLRLGARGYLKKPYTISELGSTIRRLLDAPEAE